MDTESGVYFSGDIHAYPKVDLHGRRYIDTLYGPRFVFDIAILGLNIEGVEIGDRLYMLKMPEAGKLQSVPLDYGNQAQHPMINFEPLPNLRPPSPRKIGDHELIDLTETDDCEIISIDDPSVDHSDNDSEAYYQALDDENLADGLAIKNDENFLNVNQQFQLITIAGKGVKGYKDGNALQSMFYGPSGICRSNDDRIYVADNANYKIRMLYDNEVTTIAGNGYLGYRDGNAKDAMFYGPIGICCSKDGTVYIADSGNNRIRMIYNRRVTGIAGSGQHGFKDGNACEAMFNDPTGICCSNDGRLYVSDKSNHRIRMIHNKKVTTIAGNGKSGFEDGNALQSMFNSPAAICTSIDGVIYVADTYNRRIRMILNDQVTTIAGNGQRGCKDGNALEAMFRNPQGICCTVAGIIYVTDYNNHIIRMLKNDQVTTVAGNGTEGFKDGNAPVSMLSHPYGICCSDDGILYITDNSNHNIRAIL